MNIPITYKCIRLNQLCKLAEMMKKDPEHENDNVSIYLDDTLYSANMLSGDIKRVMVEDMAYEADTRTLIIYANTEHNPDEVEAEFDDAGNFALYKFFDVMYNALDYNRNLFIPGVMVYMNSGDKEEKFYYNGLPTDDNPLTYPHAIIKSIHVLRPVISFTTCTFVIHVE